MKRPAGLSTYENEGEVQLGLVAGGPAFTSGHANIAESSQALLQVCENLGVQANEVLRNTRVAKSVVADLRQLLEKK